MLIQMAYLSSTPKLLSADDIAGILLISRENNSRDRITGLLVYRDGNVLQFLEGEEAAVKRLFDKISKDSRHRGLVKLYQKPIESRDFPDWTMGFSDLKAEGATYLEGYNEVLERGFDLSKITAPGAQKLLRVFKTSSDDKFA